GGAATRFALPFTGALAPEALADLLGLAMADSGLSADNSAQYCSSESLSHSVLGQSSSSPRLPCRRDRLLPVPDALLRREWARPAGGRGVWESAAGKSAGGWSPDG